MGQTWRSHHPLHLLAGESRFVISLYCRVRQKLPLHKLLCVRVPALWPRVTPWWPISAAGDSPALKALAPCLSKKRVRAASLISSFFLFPVQLPGTWQRCQQGWRAPSAARGGCEWQRVGSAAGTVCSAAGTARSAGMPLGSQARSGADFLIPYPGSLFLQLQHLPHPCVSFLVRTRISCKASGSIPSKSSV